MGALRVAIVLNGIALSSARRSPGGPARGPEQGPGPANSAVAHLELAVNTSKLRDAMPSIHPDGGREQELVCSSSTGPGTQAPRIRLLSVLGLCCPWPAGRHTSIRILASPWPPRGEGQRPWPDSHYWELMRAQRRTGASSR